MKKGKEYSAIEIDKFAMDNNYGTNDHGLDAIGEGFVVLKHMEKDITISFVLTGASASGYMYECIYCDLHV